MHFPANVENFGTYTFGVQINLYLWGKIGNIMNAARESMLKLIMEAFCEAALLRQALDAPEVDAAFGSLDTVAPVSVVLINEDKEPVCELKTFDNEMLFLEDDILKKMGQELDEFFEQLMSDVK